MKQFLFLPFLSIGTLPLNHVATVTQTAIESNVPVECKSNTVATLSMSQPVKQRMSAAVFKNQDIFRAEVKDFEWDVQFNILSATVYFTGTNFSTTRVATINSGSLKPISNLMAKCAPGTIVIFDDVKVMGPDKKSRTIQGLNIVLY